MNEGFSVKIINEKVYHIYEGVLVYATGEREDRCI